MPTRLDFHAISDSAIVSGLVYLALRVYSGRSAAEILATEPDYIAAIGLAKHLSPTRSNGLAALLAFIRDTRAAPRLPESSAAPAPSPLRSRGFRWLLLYRICTLLSYQIVAVTVGWHIYELTRDPLALGLVGLAEVVPYFCIAPFAGYLVDHLPRRKLGMAACTLLAVNAGVLALIASGAAGRPMAPGPSTWRSRSAAWSAPSSAPVYNALFARVLQRAQFAPRRQPGQRGVPDRAGAGPGRSAACWWAGAGKPVAYAVADGVRRCWRPPSLLRDAGDRAGAAAAARADLPQHRRGRCASCSATRSCWARMALDMFSVLFGGAVSLLPAFIKDILHDGPEALGILRAAPAVGSIADRAVADAPPAAAPRRAGAAGGGRRLRPVHHRPSRCPGTCGCRRCCWCCTACATASRW